MPGPMYFQLDLRGWEMDSPDTEFPVVSVM
jgi:hypothetical protein